MTRFGTANALALSLASTVHRSRSGVLPKSACIPAALRLARAQEVDVRRELSRRADRAASELFGALVGTLSHARRLAMEVTTDGGLAVRYAFALFWTVIRVRWLGCRLRDRPAYRRRVGLPLWVLARALLSSVSTLTLTAVGAAISVGPLLTGLVRRPRLPVPRFSVDGSIGGRMSLALVSAVVRFLPATSRDRYDEEFRAELADHGTGWSRFRYSIRLALRVWPLYVCLARRDEAVRNAMSGEGSADR